MNASDLRFASDCRMNLYKVTRVFMDQDGGYALLCLLDEDLDDLSAETVTVPFNTLLTDYFLYSHEMTLISSPEPARALLLVSEPEAVEVSRFEIGRFYSCRSVCDHDCVWTYRILSRTDKTVTLAEARPGKDVQEKRFKIKVLDNTEIVWPEGRYSMAPMLRAKKGFV